MGRSRGGIRDHMRLFDNAKQRKNDKTKKHIRKNMFFVEHCGVIWKEHHPLNYNHAKIYETNSSFHVK